MGLFNWQEIGGLQGSVLARSIIRQHGLAGLPSRDRCGLCRRRGLPRREVLSDAGWLFDDFVNDTDARLKERRERKGSRF
jgi:hypothetical protein